MFPNKKGKGFFLLPFYFWNLFLKENSVIFFRFFYFVFQRGIFFWFWNFIIYLVFFVVQRNAENFRVVDKLRKFFGIEGCANDGGLRFVNRDDCYFYAASGEYKKGEHAGEILRIIDSKKVRDAAPYCERLFVEIKKNVSK